MVDLQSLNSDLDRWLVVEKRAGDKVDNLELLSGGFSQLMVSFDLHRGGARKRLVLRASRAEGNGITTTDRLLEWDVLRSLSRHGKVPIAEPLWFDEGAALGVPCFVVERLEGTTVTRHLAGTDAPAWGPVADTLTDVLAVLHSVPVEFLPDRLARPKDWSSHIDAQIAKWRHLERLSPEPDPFIRHLANWLEDNRPAPAPLGLVHGEVNNDNLIIGPTGAISVVDWEYVRIGDPREDLGWYGTVSTAVPPDVIGADMPAFCARYRAATGLGEDIVNPAAIGWFGLLASVTVYSTLIGGPAAVEASPAAPLLSAYVSPVLSFTQLMLLRAMRALDAIRQSTAQG